MLRYILVAIILLTHLNVVYADWEIVKSYRIDNYRINHSSLRTLPIFRIGNFSFLNGNILSYRIYQETGTSTKYTHLETISLEDGQIHQFSTGNEEIDQMPALSFDGSYLLTGTSFGGSTIKDNSTGNLVPFEMNEPYMYGANVVGMSPDNLYFYTRGKLYDGVNDVTRIYQSPNSPHQYFYAGPNFKDFTPLLNNKFVSYLKSTVQYLGVFNLQGQLISKMSEQCSRQPEVIFHEIRGGEDFVFTICSGKYIIWKIPAENLPETLLPYKVIEQPILVYRTYYTDHRLSYLSASLSEKQDYFAHVTFNGQNKNVEVINLKTQENESIRLLHQPLFAAFLNSTGALQLVTVCRNGHILIWEKTN